MSRIILLRHGQSEWNLENRFTGHTDVDLTAKGEAEAKSAGILLREITLNRVFASTLKRAWRTAAIAMTEAGQQDVPTSRHEELRERHYGELTGMNKDDARQKYGKEQVRRWRLEFDNPPPGGESLKDVLARVSAFYKNTIEPRVAVGENVLICAHEHALRSMLIVLGEQTPETIAAVELKTGVPVIFEGSSGNMKRRIS